MKQPPQWLLKGGLGAVLLAAWVLGAGPLAQAQTDSTRPPLILSKTVMVSAAVAGETLTYNLTLTNTGQSSLSGVIVTDNTPVGTTLFGLNGPEGWLMTSPGQGQMGQVTWQTANAWPPGAGVILQFIVLVDPDTAGQIINDTYTARANGWSEPVRGPAVITALRAPTPTWTPPPTYTPAPTATPTFTPPAPSQVEGSQGQQSTPTFMPVATLAAASAITPQPTSPAPSAAKTIPPDAGAELNSQGLWVAGLAVAIVMALVVVTRWRR
jgi:uncharacterized repeat protein (TIGR01451 family)